MSIFTNFSKVFHHLTDEGKTLISDDLKAAMDFLSPLAHDIVRVGGPLAIKAALDAVAAAQATGGSNQDKFNSARKSIENEIKADIPVLETNTIDALVKAGVAYLHAARPVDPLSVPPAA